MAVMDFVAQNSLDTPLKPRRSSGAVRRLPAWGRTKRIAFRYACTYLLLYSVPQLLGALPVVSTLADWYSSGVDAVAIWTGAHILRLSAPIVVVPTGSGDTMAQSVRQRSRARCSRSSSAPSGTSSRSGASTAAHAGSASSSASRWRALLFGYGFAKIFPNQFPHPTLERLVEPIGEMSPMGLLWTVHGLLRRVQLLHGHGRSDWRVLLCFRRDDDTGAHCSCRA